MTHESERTVGNDGAWPDPASLGLVALHHEVEVESTMDSAHALADAGAPGGTLVIADRQRRGRGRGGAAWVSTEPSGLWMTLIERPSARREAGSVGVLALRLGIALADALAPITDGAIGLKWPNDLLVDSRKLAGVLVEARWRDGEIEWLAIGVGINVRVPAAFDMAATVRSEHDRRDVLARTVPVMRAAAAAHGDLTALELARWHARDAFVGQRVREPVAGIVRGLAPDGALLVEPADGQEWTRVVSGSLRLA